MTESLRAMQELLVADIGEFLGPITDLSKNLSWDTKEYGAGGVGMNPNFLTSVNQMADDFYGTYGRPLRIVSGYRPTWRQREIYDSGVRPAAKPGHSRHERGEAIDINKDDLADLNKLNLGKYGLETLARINDPSHVQMAGSYTEADKERLASKIAAGESAAGEYLGPLPDSEGNIKIPGPETISSRQNNATNLKFAGQPGATKGTGDFASFETPEAGIMAAMNQVDKYKEKGYTLAQGAEKWFRNEKTTQAEVDNYVKDIAKLTGHSPDTLMADISTPLFTKALSKRESSTDVPLETVEKLYSGGAGGAGEYLGPLPESKEGAIKVGAKKGMLDWATTAARAVDPASAMTGMGIWPEADNPVWNAPATREARAKVANQVVGNALFPNGVPPGREDTLGWLTENVARLWPQFVMLGTLGGYSAPAELISSSVMKGVTSGAIPFSMLGLLEEDPLKGAAAGGALGGALGMLHGFTEPFSSLIAKWLTRVAGGGAIGYTSARLEGAEPEEAGRNALLFGLFELFGMRRGEDKVRAADVVPPGLKDELVELAEKAQELRRQQYIPGTPEWVRARAIERGYPGDWLEEPHTWQEITPVDPTTGKAVVEPGRPTPTPFSEDILRRAAEERQLEIDRIEQADKMAKLRADYQAEAGAREEQAGKRETFEEETRARGELEDMGVTPMYSAGPKPAARTAKYFDFDTTDMPYYDNLMKNPEYFAREKKLASRIVYMTPDEYIRESAANRGGGHDYISEMRLVDPETVNAYKLRAEAGEKMPLLLLDKVRGDQEGRHRAAVAKAIGLNAVPVLVVDTPENISAMPSYSTSPDPAIEGARKDVSERYGIDPEQLKYIGTYKDLAQFDVTDPRSPRFKSTLSAKLPKVETPAYAAEKVPIWYSKMGRFLQSKLPGKGSGGGLANLISGWASKGEFKPDELKWSGLVPWLQEQKGTVTKQDVVDYLNSPEHRVEIEEVMKGGLSQEDIVKQEQLRAEVDNKQHRAGDAYYALVQGLKQHPETAPKATILANAVVGGSSLHDILDFRSILSRDPGLEELVKKAVNSEHEAQVARDMLEDFQRQASESGVSAKFSQYVLPGGENYRELLLRMPLARPTRANYIDNFTANLAQGGRRAKELAYRFGITLVRGEHGQFSLNVGKQVEFDTYIDDRLRSDEWLRRGDRESAFMAGHWEEPNVFAHVRLDDRVGPNGEKILFVEELQSDWALEGRRKGFKEEGGWRKQYEIVDNPDFGKYAGEAKYLLRDKQDGHIANASNDIAELEQLAKEVGEGIPPFPFSKNWHEVALKRMLRYAAENGYDQVGWTTGEQQVERYDLSKHVDEITYRVAADGLYRVEVYKDGRRLAAEDKTVAELENFVGKDITQKMLDGVGEDKSFGRKSLSGLDLKIGGEWAYNLYDRMVPQFLNKYAKQWGARVGETELLGAKVVEGIPLDKLTEKVHSLPITPSMKKSVLYEGQPMFRAIDGKPIPQVVNEDSVRAAFGGADEDISVVKAADGDYIAQTPGGINIRVYQNDGQIVADPDAFMFAYQEPLEGRPIYGEYISRPGQWRNISYDAVARIAKEAPKGTLKHEIEGHAMIQLALNDAERRILFDDYGVGKKPTDPKELRKWEMAAEERTVRAYENWEPREPHTLFEKIFQYFQNLYRSFFPNSEYIFSRMNSGYYWRRPALGSIVEHPAMYSVGRFRKDLQDAWEVLRGAAPTGRPSGDKVSATKKLYDATVKMWAPEIQSEGAMDTAQSFVKYTTEARNQWELAASLFRDYTTESMRLGYDEGWKLRAKMERNEDVRQWNPYKMAVKKAFDATHKIIDTIKEGSLGYREFYGRHLFADPDDAGSWFRRSGASKGWEKHGHYVDFDEARAAGHEPFFDNFVQNDAAALMEQWKYIGADRFFKNEEAQGRFIPIDKDGKPAREVPEGWGRTAPGVFRQGWAPRESLDVIHNHFIGDRSNIWYTKYRNLMTAWNIMHVAVGAFHAMTSMASEFGMGFAKGIPEFIGAALSGDHAKMAQALKSVGPMGVINTFRLSKQGKEARIEPGKHGPRVDDLVKLATAGGIIPREQVLPGAGIAAENLTQLAIQLKGGEIGKAMRSSIYMAGRPIMGMLVPTIKYGSTLVRLDKEWRNLSERYNKKYGTNWSPEVEANFQKDLASMAYNERVMSDRIFGEIHPDNLHWSRGLANGFKAIVAFPTWNLGTMGWIGSMVRGVAKTATGKPLDYQAKLGLQLGLGLLVTTAIANTMLHVALNNGQAPEDWKDVLIGARTGRYLNNGSPERITIASYMKDVVSLAMHMDKEVKGKGAFGVVTGPVQYAKTKFQAPFQMFKELEQNADYYGKEIFPEKGDFLQRTVGGAVGFGKWLGKHAIPFAGANIMTGRSPIAQYGPLVGIRPVPRYLLNTEAMNRIDSILSKQSPKARSAEAMENSKLVADLKQLGWNGQQQEMEEGIQEARANKQLSTIQIRHIRQAVSKDMRVAQFEKMKQMEDAIDVYSRGTTEERKLWRRDLVAKWSRTSPDKKRLLRDEYMAALALPISEEQPERVPPRQPAQSGFSILNQ